MTDPILQQEVDRLLTALAAQESFISELGTPHLAETEELDLLVALGLEVLPYLIEEMKSESPRRVAYVALVLGRLGDSRAIDPLRELKLRYQAMDAKSEWEYAVIGQCNTAIELLAHGRT
ncbi:MAG TPA: hypothetical protein VJH03_01300 [Blastocatellia bacterium]|nr:hypothetical protein [Blastocatellia bacterium]